MDNTETKKVIEIKNLHFSYNGSPIFQGIDLTVNERDFIAMIGPNGGGKTTLLKLIIGTLHPQKGEITVFGAHPPKSSLRIGYVPQNVSAVEKFPISVMDIVLMGRLGKTGKFGFYSGEDREIVRQKLEKVDMWDYRKEHIYRLSGGQRQRVFIARALASNPEILIMDEPTSSVDSDGQMKIYGTLRELNSEVTVIVISHDISLTIGFAGKVAYVNKSLFLHDAEDINDERFEKIAGTPFGHFCTIDLLKRILPGRKENNPEQPNFDRK